MVFMFVTLVGLAERVDLGPRVTNAWPWPNRGGPVEGRDAGRSTELEEGDGCWSERIF
jgi:hypothetical protein